MKTSIVSVGIDIGTTTTQVIFSRITMKDTSGLFAVSRVEIAAKEILYRGRIHFTPMISDAEINADALQRIIEAEYIAAGINKDDVFSGAVIITGESACRENAALIVSALSDYAGDFVVAAAGADLESVLAGNGSGAAAMSREKGTTILNFDIGGGTTNAALFKNGTCIDAYALDIGGRLIRVNSDGRITYISERIKNLVQKNSIKLSTGIIPSYNEVKKLTDLFAEILRDAALCIKRDDGGTSLFIDHEFKNHTINEVTFSGGVAQLLYAGTPAGSLSEIYTYGDIGPLLAHSIRTVFSTSNITVRQPSETIQATVIGAGMHSLRLSGSTVIYDDTILPKKNIPIAYVFDGAEDYSNLCKLMEEKQRLYTGQDVAFFMQGPYAPSYAQIRLIAGEIAAFYKDKNTDVLFITGQDCAKALGQTVQMILGRQNRVIFLDGITVDTGDYIDIGTPVSGVIPVVVKTLVFRC